MSIVGRKFLHASDIHIGSPLGALGGTGHISEDQMKEVIEEMRSSFDNLIDTAISENVMFVVLAGDGHFLVGVIGLNRRRAGFQAQAMCFADNCVAAHATKFLCNLARGQAFVPKRP